jgi:ABC-2 type transport system ATP-binding protein
MPQNFSLFNDLTVKENLEYLYSVYELNNFSVIQETIDKCFLSGKEQITAKNLSGGYRQLLSLAGSIMHNPRLLILDEPTSAMDPLFRSQFWNIIYSYNERGTAVLVTTHYMEEILNCKRFLCLASGRIIHKNDVENIFENGKFRSVDEMLKFYIFKETV